MFFEAFTSWKGKILEQAGMGCYCVSCVDPKKWLGDQCIGFSERKAYIVWLKKKMIWWIESVLQERSKLPSKQGLSYVADGIFPLIPNGISQSKRFGTCWLF